MISIRKKIILTAGFLTIVVLILWQITGGDYYTKFQVVEEVETKLDESDPLVAAGFYDNQTNTATVVRDEFRLGLFPTPSGIFDKQIISVTTLLVPLWMTALIILWLGRRSLKARDTSGTFQAGNTN